MKKLKWILVNGLFLVLFYFGYFEEIAGAKRLALFMAWISIFASFFMLTDPVIKKMKETGRSVPAKVSVGYDLLVTGLLVWYGAWITAPFYFLHMLIEQAAWSKAEEDA